MKFHSKPKFFWHLELFESDRKQIHKYTHDLKGDKIHLDKRFIEI